MFPQMNVVTDNPFSIKYASTVMGGALELRHSRNDWTAFGVMLGLMFCLSRWGCGCYLELQTMTTWTKKSMRFTWNSNFACIFKPIYKDDALLTEDRSVFSFPVALILSVHLRSGHIELQTQCSHIPPDLRTFYIFCMWFLFPQSLEDYYLCY